MNRLKHLLGEPRANRQNQSDAYVPFPLGAIPTEQRDMAQWIYERAREQAAALHQPSIGAQLERLASLN